MDENQNKEILNSRKEKILRWFKDPYNLAFLGIFLFALVYRLYYFSLTKNQPLWWDETDYMNIAKSWLGLYPWEFNPIRPVLFPIILFFLLGFGFEESFIRFLVALSSLLSIFLIYILGSLFFNKKVGLIASFLLSIFWSFSFYSFRILVDVPLVSLWLGSIFLFFNAYFKDKKESYFILPGVLLGLSFLLKFSSIILVFVFGIYLLLTENKNVLNKKIIYFWVSAFITVLPFFVWQYVSFGSPIAFFTKATDYEKVRSFYQSLYDQTIFSFSILKPLITFSFIFGFLFIFIFIFLSSKDSLKKGTKSNKFIFLIIWFVCSLIFFGWFNYGAYMDERYYFVFYVAVFIICGYILSLAQEYLSKKNSILGIILLIIFLFFIASQHIKHADAVIKIKIDSFKQLKEVGEWIKNNSNKNDSIIALEEIAELVYYSERDHNKEGTIYNKTHLLKLIQEKNPKYLVFSFFYFDPKNYDKIEMINYVFSDNQKFKPVKFYGPYIDNQNKIPLAIIFEISY